MPKHIASVPKLDDYRGPWVAEDGTEVEFDKEKARRYIHGLLVDKAKAQDERDAAKESLTTVTAERDEYKGQVDSKDPDQAGKIAKLEKDLEEANAKVAAAETKAVRAEVIAEKGLDEKQVKYLPESGTKEELEAKADEILEDFGAARKDPDEDEDPEDEGRQTPRTNLLLVNGGDPQQHTDNEPDFDKVAAEIVSRGVNL